MKKQFQSGNVSDVIIVGAGLPGLVLAGLLAERGFSVAIIESNPVREQESNKQKDKQQTGEALDPRALAITMASKRLFDLIGAWREIPMDRIGYFQHMSVWDEAGVGRIEFDANDLAQESLGYIVENNILQSATENIIHKNRDVSFYQPAKVSSMKLGDDKVSLNLEDGRVLESQLLIASDGQRSGIREMSGISYISEPYDQKALACIVTTESDHLNTARQRFLKDGILAFLPLFDPHRCGIVWSTEPEQAEQLKNSPEKEFCQQLTRASEQILGQVTACESRQTFPLQQAQAEKYCLHRLALIGDAAHSVHPLAGQGANLGLMDAAVLAEVLVEAKKRNRDFATHHVLRRYERWRRGENNLMMNVFTGFKILFEQQDFPIPMIRNTGLKLLNRANPLKHWIMKRAMGLTGDLPELLKTHSNI